MLNRDDAARILDYTVTAGLDAQVLTLGRGDDFCVRISGPTQFHCWSFSDWTAYRRAQKKDQARQRQEVS